MKQKDVALIAIVAVISIIVATLASNVIVGSGGGKEQEAEVVDAITATFTTPDSNYFKDDSVNPTQIIRIQENANQTPFQQPE